MNDENFELVLDLLERLIGLLAARGLIDRDDVADIAVIAGRRLRKQ